MLAFDLPHPPRSWERRAARGHKSAKQPALSRRGFVFRVTRATVAMIEEGLMESLTQVVERLPSATVLTLPPDINSLIPAGPSIIQLLATGMA